MGVNYILIRPDLATFEGFLNAFDHKNNPGLTRVLNFLCKFS